MLTLKNKIVLITGASSGIGKASAEQFAAQGARLILTARRFERLEKLRNELVQKYDCEVLPCSLDVQDKKQVKTVIDNLPENWKNIDILLNNAGLSITSDKIQDGHVDNWDIIINTNLNGVLYVTHAVLPVMLQRKQGHIINIGSVAGHEHYVGGNVYSATKHAIRALSKSLRIDLLGCGIRVSEIDPGLVHTEFSEVRWNDKQRADKFYEGFHPLYAEDIADAVVYCATRPLHVDVAELVITPTAQASAHYVHKEGSASSSIFD